MSQKEETDKMAKKNRRIFWTLVVFSAMNSLFMLNIHANGLDSLPQVIIQFPMLLLGLILFIIFAIRGLKFTFGSSEIRAEKGWKSSDGIIFYIGLGIPVYNVLIIWFLAR